MDGHLTRDGVVVVSHDPDGRRMCGVDRRIRDCDFNEVRSWNAALGFEAAPIEERIPIPSFEEVLRRFRDVPINIDLKQHSPSMVRVVLDLVRRLGAQDQVTLASFSIKTLLHLRALGYEGRTCLSSLDLLTSLYSPKWLSAHLPLRGDVAQIPTEHRGLRLATRRNIDRLHALGIEVHFWTINDPREARELAALGADAIMTDDPRTIVPALKGPARPRS
jgi:glycerophosphoryl diester phosphodiesterase